MVLPFSAEKMVNGSSLNTASLGMFYHRCDDSGHIPPPFIGSVKLDQVINLRRLLYRSGQGQNSHNKPRYQSLKTLLVPSSFLTTRVYFWLVRSTNSGITIPINIMISVIEVYSVSPAVLTIYHHGIHPLKRNRSLNFYICIPLVIITIILIFLTECITNLW